MKESIKKWNKRFMELAEFVSRWSKDPSTKCGCVITDGHNRIVSLGFNGFAAGVDDHVHRYEDRTFKYRAVIHAEENAIIFAKDDLLHCTLYVYPMPPCASCSAKIINAGISRVVTLRPSDDQVERWGSDFEIASTMFKEGCVTLEYMEVNK